MGREFQKGETASTEALLEPGMFKEQLGGLWGQSGLRGETVGDEIGEIVGPRPHRGLKASARLE